MAGVDDTILVIGIAAVPSFGGGVASAVGAEPPPLEKYNAGNLHSCSSLYRVTIDRQNDIGAYSVESFELTEAG